VHKSLVLVYAEQYKWAEFDAERKILQDARESGKTRLTMDDVDTIDILYVGSEQWEVRNFVTLQGRFHARYVFLHFGGGDTADRWIMCESDDSDQEFFAKAHPEEAKAGKRSFSLDSYTAPRPTQDGKGTSQTHGTIKFYPDGEPTYETVRADVLKVLEKKMGPVTSSVATRPNAPADAEKPAPDAKPK
jgi:hypothetical protein